MSSLLTSWRTLVVLLHHFLQYVSMSMSAPDTPSASVSHTPSTLCWFTLPDQYEMRFVLDMKVGAGVGAGVGCALATVGLLVGADVGTATLHSNTSRVDR